MISWSKPDIDVAEMDAVRRVMTSGWVTQGTETEKFEKEIADYLGCRHVVAVNNGTAAFALAMLAHDVKELTMPAYAYPSVVSTLRIMGVNVLFGEIHARQVTMIPFNSGGWMAPVSYAGMPLNGDSWGDLKVIEDAGESFGAEGRGGKTGAQGWTATFSFHAAKTLTTVEGGAVATDDDGFADRLRKIRHRGYLNFQTTDIASAIGRVQLRKLPDHLENRGRVARFYREELKGLVGFQHVPKHVRIHANTMFPIFVHHPKLLAARLGKLGVETRLGWPALNDTWAAHHVSSHVLTLPIYNTMPEAETEYVVKCVKKSL